MVCMCPGEYRQVYPPLNLPFSVRFSMDDQMSRQQLPLGHKKKHLAVVYAFFNRVGGPESGRVRIGKVKFIMMFGRTR